MAGMLENFSLAVRLARFDGDAVQHIDDSDRGVWRSFWALPLAVFMQGLAAAATTGAFAETSGPRPLLGPGWLAVTWLATLVIAAEFAGRIGKLQNFPRYVAAHNWAAAVQAIVLAGATILAGMTGVGGDQSALLVVAIVGFWALVYDWFVAKSALGADGAPAAMLIAIQLFAAWFIMRVAGGIAGV